MSLAYSYFIIRIWVGYLPLLSLSHLCNTDIYISFSKDMDQQWVLLYLSLGFSIFMSWFSLSPIWIKHMNQNRNLNWTDRVSSLVVPIALKIPSYTIGRHFKCAKLPRGKTLSLSVSLRGVAVLIALRRLSMWDWFWVARTVVM